MSRCLNLASILFVGMTALMVAGCSVFGGKAAEETPYAVVEREGDFEIRQYDDYTIARTFVEASYDTMDREAFGRLFDYITGDNTTEGEISMTAPVLMAQDGEGWWMAFVLPQGLDAAGAPGPTNPQVRVIDIEGPRMAAVRYSGTMDEETNANQAARLRDWIVAHDLAAAPGYQVAGYNPPWTLPFLRRTEILIALR